MMQFAQGLKGKNTIKIENIATNETKRIVFCARCLERDSAPFSTAFSEDEATKFKDDLPVAAILSVDRSQVATSSQIKREP